MAFCVFPTLFECFAPGEGIELYLLLSRSFGRAMKDPPPKAQDKLNVKIVCSLWPLKLMTSQAVQGTGIQLAAEMWMG